MTNVGIRDHCRPFFRMQVLTVKNQFIYDNVCLINVNNEVFTPGQEIHGLGLRGGNNLNMPRCSLLKTQENNSPFLALKTVQ